MGICVGVGDGPGDGLRALAVEGAIELGIDLASYMHRHHCGDWGNLDECDKQSNEEALIHGDRILSCYQVGGGNRIYIITEADRQSTCVMLPEEY